MAQAAIPSCLRIRPWHGRLQVQRANRLRVARSSLFRPLLEQLGAGEEFLEESQGGGPILGGKSSGSMRVGDEMPADGISAA